MSEPSVTEPITDETPHGDETPTEEPHGTNWAAEARKWEKRAKENVAAAQKLAELEEAQKSEEQKTAERLSAAEAERDDALGKLMRFTVASEVGIPAEAAHRLQGSTREELETDAKELLTLIKASESAERHAAHVVPTAGKSVGSGGGSVAEQFAAVLDNL